MTNPTPEQIEAAAKAMSEATSGFLSEGSWRHLAREALVAAAGAAPQEPVDEAQLAEVRMIRDAVDRWEADGDDERLVNEVLDPWISKHLRGGGR